MATEMFPVYSLWSRGHYLTVLGTVISVLRTLVSVTESYNCLEDSLLLVSFVEKSKSSKNTHRPH